MNILLISTGGTIAMQLTSGSEVSALAATANSLAESLVIGAEDRITPNSFSQMPSSHFNSERAAELAELIMEQRTGLSYLS